MGYNKNDFEGSTSFLTGAELLFHDKSEASHPHILQLIAKLATAEEGAELRKNKNVPGGYAGLDGEGRVLYNILPEITDSLIGKGAITEEKLSKEILDKLSHLVEKEDGKVLSDNNFSNENLEAVLKIGSLDKNVARIIANYVGKNTFNEHVQDANMHVSTAELDSAIKAVQEYASTVAEGRQIVEETAKRAEKDLEKIVKHANACADNAEKAKSAASQAEKAYEDAVGCAGICINTSETAEDAAERAKQAAETTEEKMVSASQDYSNAVKHTATGNVVTVNNASFVEHEIKAKLLSKNLIPFPYFDIENTSLYGVSIEAHDYGAVTLSGTATNDIYWSFYDAGSYDNPEENVPLGVEPLRNYNLSFGAYGSISGGELSLRALVGDAPEGSISLRQREWLKTTGETVTGQMYSSLLTFSLILYIPSGTTVNCEIRPSLRLAEDMSELYEWNDMSYVNPTQAKLIQYGENLLDIGRADNIYGATVLEGITGKKYLQANVLDAKYCEIELSYLARILEQLAGHTITFSAAISNRNVGQPAIIITYVDGSTVMAEGAGDKVTLKLPKPAYPVESIKIRPLSSSGTFTDTSTLIYDLSLKIDDDSWGYKDFIMNEFAPNEKGEISGMKSLSQAMTFETYDGVVVDLEYNADTEKTIDASAEQTKEEIQAEADKIYATKKDVIEKAGETKREVNQNFANAFKGYVSGNAVRADGVSPIEHEMRVKLESENLWDINKTVQISTYATMTIEENTVVLAPAKEVYGVGIAVKDLPLEIGETYTFSVDSVTDHATGGANWGFRVSYTDGTASTINKANSMTITIPKEVTRVNFYIGFPYTGNKEITITNIQCRKGTEIKPFVPYVEDLSAVKLMKRGKNFWNQNLIRFGKANGWTKTETGAIFTRPEGVTGGDYAACPAVTFPKGTTIRFSVKESAQVILYKDAIYGTRLASSADGRVSYTVQEENLKIIPTIIVDSTVNNLTATDIQLEIGESETSYEPYVEPIEYTVNADGTVEGVTSLYPTTTLAPDKSGVVVSAEFNKDINRAFAELQQAIISLGGNV